MSKFYTEAEAERFLDTETRTLTLPNGQKESVTVFRLTWELFDGMHKAGDFSHDQLIGWSYSWYQRDQKHSFTTYFENMVAYTSEKVKATIY